MTIHSATIRSYNCAKEMTGPQSYGCCSVPAVTYQNSVPFMLMIEGYFVPLFLQVYLLLDHPCQWGSELHDGGENMTITFLISSILSY